MLADLASDLIKKFPKFASKNDDVLMAIAKTFPSGDYGETSLPPCKLLLLINYSLVLFFLFFSLSFLL